MCWLMMIPMRSVCMWGSMVEVSEPRATTTRPFGAAATGPAASATNASITINPSKTRPLFIGLS